MIYIVGIKVSGVNVLLVNEDTKDLIGSDNIEDIKVFPDLNRYHVAGTEWSGSATIWWMQFSPRIFQFESLEKVGEALLDRKIYTYRSISGRCIGTPLRVDYEPTVAKEITLIDKGVETAKPFYENL